MENAQTLCILGRQPALGLAELESLYPGAVTPVGESAAVINAALDTAAQRRLGGTIKLARVVATLETNSWAKIADYLQNDLPFVIDFSGDGKLQLGLSSYGFPISSQKLLATGLNIKKALGKATGRSVRLVSSKNELYLSSPQVIHNGLVNGGYEIVVLNTGKTAIIARTVAEQDIAAYARRDQNRPKRDAKVGMLPPKLAQIIVNLAAADAAPSAATTVLDPFCGTGVLLQEAQLMGYGVMGSDLEPRMVAYTRENLEWLRETFTISTEVKSLQTGDATSYTWPQSPDIIACEAYLGRPFTAAPTAEVLSQTASEVNLIIKKFLRNIHGQLKSGTRLCIAVPAWQTGAHSFRHLPLIDALSDLGYNRVSFEHAGDDDLLYYREDQTVARQLLVLTRK